MYFYRSGVKSFSEISWFDYQPEFHKRIKDEIERNGKEYILGVNEDEYITYLVDKYKLEPLVIVHESESVKAPRKSKVNRRNIWGDEYEADAYEFDVSYNFTGTAELFKVQPSTYSMTYNNIYVDDHTSIVSFTVTIYKQDAEEFKKAKSEAYHRAFANISNINECISQVSNSLEALIRSTFNGIKNSYKSENDFFAAIKVKTNEETKAVFSAPTIKKKQIIQPKVKDKTALSSEPTMDQEMYNEILTAINQFGKNMEKKPSLYIGKDEEGLRDQFVLILETKYEGYSATGETFNRNGKTDIILKYAGDGSNLFVAECKFWTGPAGFQKAIDQLLGYLTWRDSKVALMIFVKNVDMTNVVNSIVPEAIKHPNFKKSDGKRGDSSFSFIFSLPQDKEKDVQIEIMAFHYDKK